VNLTDVPVNIFWPGGNKLLLDGHPGAPIAPEKRLGIMSADDFEILVLQWAHYCLKKTYVDVRLFAGAGDKGRDVVGYKDQKSVSPRHWDLYQCKHYDNKLMPSNIWLELGKLCYYCFTGDYPTVPDGFFFVSPKGFGPSLQDLFQKPEEMKKQLIENWEKKCQDEITTGISILLEGALKQFIEQFDFSIVDGLEPTKLLEQYSTTPFYAQYFGGKLKQRTADLTVPAEIDEPKETHYVTQLYEVYTESASKTIKHHSELNALPKLRRHFDQCRKFFYKAESLKVFARDSYPEHAPFDDLVEQIKDGVQPTLSSTHSDSLTKVNAVCDAATKVQLDANILTPQAQPGDRIGICHHLANDKQITWVEGS
jgi:hypothetical protein